MAAIIHVMAGKHTNLSLPMAKTSELLCLSGCTVIHTISNDIKAIGLFPTFNVLFQSPSDVIAARARQDRLWRYNVR